MKACQEKCCEDPQSTTSFVTWSLHSGNKAGVESVPARRAAAPSERDDDGSARRERDGTTGSRTSASTTAATTGTAIEAATGRRARPPPGARARPPRAHRRDTARAATAAMKTHLLDAFDVRAPGPPRPSAAAASAVKTSSLMDNTLWNRQMKDVTLDVVDLPRVRSMPASANVVQSGAGFNCFFLMLPMNEFAGS